jgi:hypothetical protein
MKRLIAAAFLFICPSAAFSGSWNIFVRDTGDRPEQQISIPSIIDPPAPAPEVADQTWLTAQADALLSVIKVLCKGDEQTVQKLVQAQDGMDPEKKIELRINLIQTTVDEQAKKAAK